MHLELPTALSERARSANASRAFDTDLEVASIRMCCAYVCQCQLPATHCDLESTPAAMQSSVQQAFGTCSSSL